MSTPISSTGSSTTSSAPNPLLQDNSTQQAIQALLQNQQQQGSTISFGGLVSGLNTNAIIQAEMSMAQLPVVELQNAQAQEQAKLSAWQDLNTKLQALQSAASTLSLQSTTGARQLTVGGGDSSAVTGTATADASNGTFTLNVSQMATGTQVVSTGAIGTPISSTDIATSSDKLPTAVTTGSFTVNGQTVNVLSGETFGAILSAISTATGGTVTGSVVSNTIQLTSNNGQAIQLGSLGDTSNFLTVTKLAALPAATTLTSSGPVGEVNPDAILNNANINGLQANAQGSIVINNTVVNYNTGSDSLSDVINRINASSAGVTASYDPNSDEVTFISSKTGNLDISVADGSGNLVSSLSMASQASHILGTSAAYSVNGGPTQYSLSNQINNILPGVDVTLQDVTTNGGAKVTISQDLSTAETAIQSFVTAYNTVADWIQTATSYDSTTKQAGIFLGDPTIDDIQNQLDTGLFISNGTGQGLNAAFADVSTMGLSTGPVGSQPGTTTDLQFDSSQFEQAMSQNPAAVVQLATTVFGSFSQLTLNLTKPFGVVDSAIQSETTQITDYQNEISDQQQLLAQQQQILQQEYSSLEQSLAQIESQSQSGAAALAAMAGNAQASTTGSTGTSTDTSTGGSTPTDSTGSTGTTG